MSERFKVPEPEPMERYDSYFRRMTQAFEDWANDRIDAIVARAADPSNKAP